MPTQTTQRRTRTAYRNDVTAGVYRSYQGYVQERQNTARAYEFPVTYPKRVSPIQTQKPKQAAKPKRVSALRVAMYVVLGMGMCMLMLYRYAAILESAETIETLSKQVSDIAATNQALQAKIDRGLELGVLESYATGQLGMIRPDSSQMFYVDMQLSDAAQRTEQEGQRENNVLQGTPGALVNAIRVLN